MRKSDEKLSLARGRLPEHEFQRKLFLVASPARYSRQKTVRQSRRDKGKREKQSVASHSIARAIVAEKKRHGERVKREMGREKTSNGERFLP